MNLCCCLIKHPANFPWKHHTTFPETSLILYHKSPSNLRQCVWSILRNIADTQPGLKEDQPRHLVTHCCGNLLAHVCVDWSEFICRYPSASRSVMSSKIFIIHSHQSSASEMEDTALGILFYFLFPEIIFSAEITVPILSPICAACPAHLILLNLITQIIFSEEYRSLTIWRLTTPIWVVPQS